jgi:hypothetical protein
MPKGLQVIGEIGEGIGALQRNWQDILKTQREQTRLQMEEQRFGLEKQEMEFKQKLLPTRLQQQETDVAISAEQLKAIKQRNKMQEEAQQEYNRVTNLKMKLPNLGYGEEETGAVLAAAQRDQVIGEDGSGKVGEIKQWMPKFYASEEGKKVVSGVVDHYSKVVVRLQRKLSEAQEKGADYEEIDKIKKDLAKNKKFLDVHGGISQHIRDQEETEEAFKEMQGDPNWSLLTRQQQLGLAGVAKMGDRKKLADAWMKEITSRGQRVVDKSIDLGDKVRVQYSDGTIEDLPKGVPPIEAARETAADKRVEMQQRGATQRTRERIAATTSREEQKKELDVDKMYAQFNVGRITKQGRTKLSDILARSFNIAVDPEREWPKLTREQFKTFITTGELPPEPVKSVSPKDQAIKWLKDNKQLVTEKNIGAVIMRFGYK